MTLNLAQVDLNHAAKAQWIRALDVFVFGPLMMWGGVVLAQGRGTGRKVGGASLAAVGLGTIVFNGVNWFRVREMERSG